MPVGPLSLLIQGSLAMALAALTKSTCLGAVAAFIPFAGWTMYFYPSYPAWFTLQSMAIDFVVLLLFAMAGAVHSFFWEAHALLDGTLMYKTAAVIKRRIREERTSPELKNSKTFINEFLLAVFWRSIVFLAFLIAAHVPMELNWASSNLVAAWGIQMACVAVAWTLFYFLYEYLGTSNERARLKTLFNHDGELIPFTIFLCLANLLYVTAFFLVRHFGTVVYWEDQGWWVVPAASGAVLVALLYGIGQCVPLRHQIHSNRKLRRKMPA